MNKYFLLVSLFLSTSFLVSAAPKQKKADTWIDASIKAKTELQTQLQKTGMPIISSFKKHKEKAEPFAVDLKGVDKLVLITAGGPDGSDYDQAVWGNARLIKADGTAVWLDEVPFEYGVAGWAKPKMNINAYDHEIFIAGKEYKHGVFCHANGTLVYPIKGEYVRFEAEVGIDDTSSGGSVYFQALNVVPKFVGDELIAKYPEQIGMLGAMMDGLDTWLITPDASIEKQAVEAMVGKLKDGSYYKGVVQQIANEKDVNTQIRKYLELFEKLQDVYALQGELEWLNMDAIKLAFADMSKQKGFDAAKYQPMLNELVQLQQKGFSGIYKGDEQAIADARKALDNKKAILLGNPLLDPDKIVAVRYKLGSTARQAMAPSLGTQANNWSNQESARRSGFDAEIVELSNLRGDMQMKSIFKPIVPDASIADLRMHWDANRVMFTTLTGENDKRWNVYEVKLDGTGCKKLIENEEPDLEFYDGTYLPDGRIIANSNIGYQGVPCVSGDDPVGNMVLYTPEQKNLRRLTFDQDANWNPVVMNNGRVMYTRWEYTDLTHYYSRIVMHMNPDGTENKALYGSGSMFPNSTFDIQPLPGHGSAFVGIISGHHGVARSGRLIIFDPTKGRKNVQGMVQEIPHRNRPIQELIKDELVNGVWPQFVKPTPLNDKYFLVAAKLDPQSLWGLYLVDIYDNVTCLMQAEGEGYISPILVKETKTPPAIPDRVKLNEKEATIFIQDIYEGEGLRGIPRGTVKELRLHAYEYAYVKTRSDHNWHGIQSGWDIKRLLGTVPVEEDGSAIFKVPANTPISIQPIDKDGVAVQWMRSWVTGQPGEVVSCIGCHEDQNQIPIPKRVMASQKAAVPLKAPEGGVRSFTFDLEIQPILDRACIACHNGEGKAFDLRGGKKDKLGYGTSYLNIHPYVHRQGGEGDMVVLQPYEYHPNTSELVRILKKGHHNVKLTDAEWLKLYNWIDYNAPDKGYFDANVLGKEIIPYQGFDQIERRKELTDKYANGMGVDWKKEIADYASYLKAQGPITPVMPEKAAPVKVKNVKAKGWPFDKAAIKDMLAKETSNRKEVEIAPGVKINFVRIPAGEFVMGSYNGESDAYPTAKVKIDKPFWMGEMEITNQQFNAIYPDHDSRFVDQLWKDHVVQGYPANEPNQPVIRVNYNDAMDYCKQLSEKTGLNITLPTEAQWEWACRAGSDSDFWYGDMNTDFGKYENLADKTTLLFAVSGVDPKPMSPNSYWYKYYTYLPKEEGVDDGQLIQTGEKVYEANPFGLYNMHGNVSEWTRSDYVPYPYNPKTKLTSDHKVVRGGSYIERPKFSTAYARKAYYPYQRVFNVGFRVIIED
ncbi:SUMF1/EgtB/PvdO family nonheme iron enzyme [Parabacteroides sp. BX2]|jgi:formylglycine-generating enzyme required for sulfatase activity|uniref:SUMF1/EgtB/PvdO family nonheme iron enzyme n=1 Tax=Parabacteroides segnis TaxID=2763058 RepID=A0ABR7EB39_9BACT|nr:MULTISPECIES: SUMF1/EgtB/PvdO family nonheme iron enzyme [Parabacteroides]MBC5646254.1 SUMF1/EgtB/PvdO family nonheme iron enzyme [Parabacteroides segnis]MCM0716240.1 SUMF1/EgtB/PvdO family nonheme iron enzyme [Parabacteroides sp. TA-V-105]